MMTYAFDEELVPWLDRVPEVRLFDEASLAAEREHMSEMLDSIPPYHPSRQVKVWDTIVPGSAEAPDVRVRVYRPETGEEAAPGLLYIHGGGFVLGNVDMVHTEVLQIADKVGVVVVSVDYRLAPEHPFPAPVEDCYAALTWLTDHADELGVDGSRLGVAGESAGGGLSAAVALLARDRSGPRLCFQYLGMPQLDDRLNTPSMESYTDTPLWNRPNVAFSWASYLGHGGTLDVSPYAAPARAEDLSNLPPAYVTTCEFDPLRDEGIIYAQRLLQAGVSTELHHYPGTFHGSVMIRSARITDRMVADMRDALRRGLGMKPGLS
jgi:acetyl esterase